MKEIQIFDSIKKLIKGLLETPKEIHFLMLFFSLSFLLVTFDSVFIGSFLLFFFFTLYLIQAYERARK